MRALASAMPSSLHVTVWLMLTLYRKLCSALELLSSNRQGWCKSCCAKAWLAEGDPLWYRRIDSLPFFLFAVGMIDLARAERWLDMCCSSHDAVPKLAEDNLQWYECSDSLLLFCGRHDRGTESRRGRREGGGRAAVAAGHAEPGPPQQHHA